MGFCVKSPRKKENAWKVGKGGYGTKNAGNATVYTQ